MELAELDRLRPAEQAGFPVERLDPPAHRSAGTIVRFRGPSGHVIDLEHGQLQVDGLTPINHPGPRRPVGMTALDRPRVPAGGTSTHHLLPRRPRFRLTEQIGRRRPPARHVPRAVPHPHDIAFLTGPDGGFHHAYWVDEWNDLRHAADTCAYHGVEIDAGPTRHGATRGCRLYFDPAGNRNEVYTGGYWFDPDDEPTTWTEAEMGRAVFTYRGQVDPSFMTVHS